MNLKSEKKKIFKFVIHRASNSRTHSENISNRVVRKLCTKSRIGYLFLLSFFDREKLKK